MRLSILLIGAILLLPTLVFAKVYIIEQKTMQIGGTGYAPANDSELAINVSGSMVVSGNITMANSLVCTAANGLCAGTAGNASWNQTAADALYYPLSSNPAGYGTSSLTLAQVSSNVGNWSADKGTLPNLTLAQINENMGNYSANPSGFISSVPYQSSAAGWTNNTQNTSTSLNVDLTGQNRISFNGPNENISQVNIGNIDFSARGYYVFSADTNADGVGTDDAFGVNSAGVRRFTIERDGNIGVGTSSASARFQVVSSSTLLSLLVQNTTNTHLVINASTGNIGIGTATPNSKFNILDDGSGSWVSNITSQRKWILDGSGSQLMMLSTASSSYIGTRTGTPFTFRIGDADKMTLNNTGAVGIGTTAPTATLDVRALNTGTNVVTARGAVGQTAPIYTAEDSSGVQLWTIDAGSQMALIRSDTTTTAPWITIRKRGNSTAWNGNIVSGQELGRIRFEGYNASSYNVGAYISAVATQAFNRTTAGTKIDFYTTSPNTLTNSLTATIGRSSASATEEGLIFTGSSSRVVSFETSSGGYLYFNNPDASWVFGKYVSPYTTLTASFWNGSASVHTLTLTNSSSTEGTVGIRTLKPSQALDVNGSINISATDGKLYLPSIPGTGHYVCFNETDKSLFRNTTCP